MATSVVVVTQLLVALPFTFIDFRMATFPEFVSANAWFLTVHGWYTVPIALVGTALFVWWLKREATAPPSPAGRAGWRS